MLDRAEAIKRVDAFMTNLLTDFEAVPAMITPEFAWDNFLPEQVPFGGHYEGLAGLQIYLGQLAAAWEIGELVFRDHVFDATNQRIAVFGVEKGGRSLLTGRACDMDFVWEFRFDPDGRVSYVREYNDTASIGATFDCLDA